MKSSAKIIADSISEHGKRITTFELEYPRIIHAEKLTHRMFSRNAASSRAIPVSKMIQVIKDNPFIPSNWTSNKSGMQGGEPLTGYKDTMATTAWNKGLSNAVGIAKELTDLGVHKQYANRGLEPYSHIKTVVTATEWDNFFHLRNHTDAQPEIQELAKLMQDELNKSIPEALRSHEWHTPYVAHSRDEFGGIIYGNGLSPEEAKKVSVSCCAQVSYRVLNESLDKALDIYEKLIGSTPKHWSPFEHIAKPMNTDHWDTHADTFFTEKGVTHMDKSLAYWSGNFCGWTQLRQTF